MSGLLLHLSGPLQAWGSEADFEVRTTHRWPTRPALTGLLAAALGQARGADSTDLAALRFTVRVDRPGQREMDFHTVGGGHPRHHTPPTADGTFKKLGTGTILTDRWYLTDAAFTVAVTGPPATIALCATAVERPAFAPYLGRRSCPPDAPILIRVGLADPVAELDRVPLHRDAARSGQRTPVTFLYESAPEPGTAPDIELRDLSGPGRTLSRRSLWERQRELPDARDAGRGTAWINALTAYREACQ